MTIVLVRYYSVFESQVHYTPNYKKLDIIPLLEKESLSETDYHCLFYQTGLSPSAIDEILQTKANPVSDILQIQDHFFTPVSISCQFNSPVSKEEHISPKEISSTFAPYYDSYLLITSASHTFFYRNGHAALIIDSKNHKTLEAAVLGSNSSIQTTKKWTSYPNFILLRLKNLTPETAHLVTTTAIEKLYNIPYRLTAGLFTSKNAMSKTIKGTQCAHLVWASFWQNGFDIDGDGGRIVTPHDLLESDLLEIVQIYGFNPQEYEEQVLN